MIELETIIRFNDVKENILREVGDRFKADEERARYLVDERKLCVVVKIEKETKEIKEEIIEDEELEQMVEEPKERRPIKIEKKTTTKKQQKKNLKELLKRKWKRRNEI